MSVGELDRTAKPTAERLTVVHALTQDNSILRKIHVVTGRCRFANSSINKTLSRMRLASEGEKVSRILKPEE